MDVPPVLTGAVNATLAWVSPAIAVPIVGAAGATGLIVNEWLTCGAGWKLPSPAWPALIVQVPAATKVRMPPDVIVQTPVVADVKVTVSPELAVAASVGEVP